MQNARFQLAYSYCLEKICFRFYSRLDKLLSFLLLLGAMAAVESRLSGWGLGVFLAVIAAFQIVYTPAAKAQTAKMQMARYAALWQQQDFGLNSEMQAADSDAPESLIYPACLAALVLCGQARNEDLAEAARQRPLRPSEKLAAAFAGETPEFRF
ncbi:MAG: hypothetical protein Q4D82_04660 [Neisseria sp.]|nr:hypothetical protein [Neisseria sp.]